MFPLHSFVVRPLLLLVAVFFLLGCGSAAQQPVTPTPTAIPPTFTSVAATSTALPTATTPPPTPTAIAPADVGAESLILVTLLDGDDGTVTQAFATALTEVAASLDTDLPIRVAVTDTVASETRARPLGESYGATLLVYGAITDEGIQVTVDTPTNTLISVPTTYHDRFFPFVYLPTDISVLPDAGSTYTYLARVVIGVERALVGEMEAALATMEATLEEEATFNRGHAHFFLSNWYYSYQGEYDTAVEQVELALAEDPDLAEAFVMRGSLHHYHYEQEAARAAFDRAIELRPDMAVGYFARAIAENDWYEIEAARADLAQAIALRALPLYTQWDAYLQCYSASYDYHTIPTVACAEGLETLNGAIDLQPEEPTHYLMAAYLHQELGQSEERLDALNTALDLDPDLSGAYSRRAAYYRQHGDSEAANADAAKARALSPNSFDAANPNLVDIYPDATLETLDAYIAKYPWSATAYYQRYRYHYNLEDFDQALVDITKAIELRPYGLDYYYSRSQLYLKQGNREAWLADLEPTLEQTPGSPGMLDSIVSTFINLDDIQGGFAFLEAEAQRTPDNGVVHFNRGRLYDAEGNYDQAIAEYTRAIELRPYDFYYYRRAASYNIIENYDAAVADYQEAIDRVVTIVSSYYSGLCDANVGREQYPSAIDQCTEAIKLNDKDIQAYFYRGMAHFYENHDSQARADFERVIELDPDGSTGSRAREWIAAIN